MCGIYKYLMERICNGGYHGYCQNTQIFQFDKEKNVCKVIYHKMTSHWQYTIVLKMAKRMDFKYFFTKQ